MSWFTWCYGEVFLVFLVGGSYIKRSRNISFCLVSPIIEPSSEQLGTASDEVGRKATQVPAIHAPLSSRHISF